MKTNGVLLSIIIFNDDSQRCVETMKSILAQPLYQQQKVQVVLVDCKGSSKEDELEELTQQAEENLVRIKYNGKYREYILEEILDYAEGEYVNFSKAGVIYYEKSLDKILKNVQKKQAQISITRIRATGRPAEIREQNNYVRTLTKGINLDADYHLIHCNYASYFIQRNAMTDISVASSNWALAVLQKVFYTVVQAKVLQVDKKQMVDIGDPQLLTSSFTSMLIDQNYEEFWTDFLCPVLQFCKGNEDISRRNAEYNLLYYCRRMQGMLLENEEEKLELIRSWADEVIDYTRDKEVLLVNQYFNRAYKCFLLNRTSWDASDNPEVLEREVDILNEENAPNELSFIELEQDKVTLEGKTMLYNEASFEINLLVNGEKYPCELSEKEGFSGWFGMNINHTEYYKCQIPLEKDKVYEIQVLCAQDDREVIKKIQTFGPYAPLSDIVSLFVNRNGWLFSYNAKKGVMCLEQAKASRRLGLQGKKIWSLMKENNAARKALIARTIYGVLRLFKKKQIWLVSDRVNRGDDNGESFFRYLSEHPQPDVNAYYVIGKDCPDYERMKQYGKVVPVYSWKHKFLHLLSDYVISSQANKPVMNPFGKIGTYYSDIIGEKPIVFLQHGVIKDDLSGWLNRYNRNLYGFVTTTKAEYQSILDYEYYYSPREVWLTGLPRHDYLEHNEKKYITIMPTWRKTLTGGVDASGAWKVGTDFAQSRFFHFYNDLLNDERLIQAAKEHGYTICFFPHPNVKPAMPLFHQHPDVVFWDTDKPYREVYAESNLILTDYSSAVFDFAYLRKPIVYCQFDRKEFFAGGHSYVEGYYNYQTDGFGEVEETLEDTVTRLIEYMENGCQLKPEYRKRIDEAFAFSDKNCCQRVLMKIRDRDNN